MAIEVVRIPYGTDHRYLQGYLGDGHSVVLDDYSSGFAEAVSVICDEDEANSVYRFPPEELATDEPDHMNVRGVNDSYNKVCDIQPGTNYNLHRVDKDGNRELVIFKHMAPFVIKAADYPDIVYRFSMN